jgi:rhodanese-related sulfurtransferase
MNGVNKRIKIMKIFKIFSLGILTLIAALFAGCNEEESLKIYGDEKEMIEDAKSQVSFISIDDFKTLLDEEKKIVIIDCREPEEIDPRIPVLDSVSGLKSFTIQKATMVKKDSIIETVMVDTVVECYDTIKGVIKGALNIPRGLLEFQITDKVKRTEDIYIYCSNGDRAALAAKNLPPLKYSNVHVIEGGFADWFRAYPDLVDDKPEGAETSAPAKSSGGGCGG